MLNINELKCKSQQLYKLPMLQERENHKNDLSSSIPKHAKRIHKKRKQPLFSNKKKQEDRFPRHLSKESAVNQRVDIDSNLRQTANDWLSRTRDWYQESKVRSNECLETEINKLAILSSIQELFSLSSSERLTNEVDIDCFYRYCRAVSFLDAKDARNIILTSEKASGVGNVGIDRHANHIINSIFLVSTEEIQTIQKRASFMEKLKLNQSKYDASIGRMSEISKELAFNYRIYIQKRSQLIDAFNSVAAKIPLSSENPYSAYQEYTHLLIKKNLRNAFNRAQVDPLNYFKFKEYSQANRIGTFHHILSPEELKMFIDRRRPKRGRKVQLATACSVCLSDYHELSNPFQSCGVCGLRVHKMCFSLENSRCGNCAYQKVERHVKEQVSSCFICKQRGLMTVKLGEKEFAHAFCLLVHGYWRLKEDNKHEEDDACLPAISGRLSSEGFLQSKFRNFCSNQIEFVNPNQNCTTVSLPAIDSTIFGSHQIELEQFQSDNNSSLGGIGVIRERQEIWEHNQENKKTTCKYCLQSFYQNCYLACGTCGQQYHILCGYLSGFDLKLSDNCWSTGMQNSIFLNCCCERTSQVGWSRKYKLNYERIAFKTDESFETVDKDLMQNDKDELFFHI